MPRPHTYTDEIGEEICRRLVELETTRSIAADPSMPSRTTLFRWLSDPALSEFRDHYRASMDHRQEMLACEISDLALDAQRRLVEGDYMQGTAGMINAAVNALEKSAKLLAPKRFGSLIRMADADGDPLASEARLAADEIAASLDRLAKTMEADARAGSA